MDEELLRQRRKEKILARSGLSPLSHPEAELTSDPSQNYKKIQQVEHDKVLFIQKIHYKIRCYVIFFVSLCMGFLSVERYLVNPFYLFLMSYIPYRSIRGLGYFIGADNYGEMNSIQKELMSELLTELSLCLGGIILSLGLFV